MKKKASKKERISVEVDQDTLLNKFFGDYYEMELTLHQGMALDLYRAINCYRYYDDVNAFILENPDIASHEGEIVQLWEEFDQLTAPELAEIAIKALQEV